MSSATAKDGPRLKAPEIESIPTSQTAMFIPDKLKEYEFHGNVELSGKGDPVKLAFHDMFPDASTDKFFLKSVTLSEGHGESISLTTNDGRPLMKPRRVFTNNGAKLDDSIIVPQAETTIYDHTPGPYASLTREAITRGISDVTAARSDGTEMQMKSIPYPPKSGAFFMAALEHPIRGEPPVVPPGTLAKHVNPLNKNHFLLNKDDHDAVVAAYMEARDDHRGLGPIDGLTVHSTPGGSPSSFKLSATVMEPSSSVAFDVTPVTGGGDGVL